MKTRLVLWGTNAQDERVLIAMQLRAQENKVDVWVFLESEVTPDFAKAVMNEWRNNLGEVPFPAEATYIERELTLVDSLLPDDLKVEKTDWLIRAQAEWQFAVLSTKLSEQYRSEINEIQDKIEQITDYSADLWESLKEVWGKVQSQVRERHLFREHADELRDMTNMLFEKLKEKRPKRQNEFEEVSKELYAAFTSTLDDIERRIENGIQRFPEIFEDLRKAQADFKGKRMVKTQSEEIWNRLDTLFKSIKEKRFGDKPQPDAASQLERMTKRYEGLLEAIDRLQVSIDRDKEEMDFQKKRIAKSEGQLEEQLRQAKMNMAIERLRSKELKMADMMTTKADLEAKINSAKAREERKNAAEAEKTVEVATESTATEAVAEVAATKEAYISEVVVDAAAGAAAVEKM